MAPCASLVPSGSDYANTSLQYQVCSVTGAKTGERLVSGDDYINLSFDYSYSHVWRNIGILFVFWAAFLVMSTTITELRTKSATTQAQNRLDYRRGHEPDVGKDIGQRTKFMNDSEAQISETTLREVKSHLSQFSGFVKSTSVFTWEDISYDIALSDHSRRRLLDNVSGYVRPGTLTALMGESGAGKTTLLQVVAQRMKTGIVSGRTLVNGSPPGHAFRRMTGYVQQQDVHLPSSTVREALQFSAKLRQPKETPLVEKLAYVEKVIDLLEMQDFAEAIIGIPGRGLDNEQRKRTTIAVELVAKPEILLFLDEPTSGLDSLSAWSIVRLLRKLADSGQAILCTIHQPSSLIFEQFDRLLLLAKGGKPVYFGDIAHHSRTVIDYFESHGAPSITPGNNPAEWMLDVIGAGSNAATTNDWNDIWTKSELHREAAEEIKMLNVQHDAEKAHNQDHNANSGTNYAEPWWVQYRAFQYRLFLHYWRTVPFVVSKIMLNVVAGLFLGFTFYKADSSVQGLQNKVSTTFLWASTSPRADNGVTALRGFYFGNPSHARDAPIPASLRQPSPAFRGTRKTVQDVPLDHFRTVHSGHRDLLQPGDRNPVLLTLVLRHRLLARLAPARRRRTRRLHLAHDYDLRAMVDLIRRGGLLLGAESADRSYVGHILRLLRGGLQRRATAFEPATAILALDVPSFPIHVPARRHYLDRNPR